MFSKLKTFIKYREFINLKTIRFNLHYFPLSIALKFPIYIAKNTIILKRQGQIVIDGPLYPGKIQIGTNYVGLFPKKINPVVLELKGKLIFKGIAKIGFGSKIIVGESGELELGHNFHITAASEIIAFKRIVFGKDCLLSWQCLFMDTDFHKIFDTEKNVINPDKEIAVGNNVWFGCKSTILKGCEIPNNTIIAAGSVINKTFVKEDTIIGGSPSLILRENISWE